MPYLIDANWLIRAARRPLLAGPYYLWLGHTCSHLADVGRPERLIERPRRPASVGPKTRAQRPLRLGALIGGLNPAAEGQARPRARVPASPGASPGSWSYGVVGRRL